ncbi:MAG: hypothetical protein J3R72DRAFT_138376 [Linnemannia gamsii]|nr:MAG: hypothetical protein J3R72DRAFT_138376 [Linnemannia gamsii]
MEKIGATRAVKEHKKEKKGVCHIPPSLFFPISLTSDCSSFFFFLVRFLSCLHSPTAQLLFSHFFLSLSLHRLIFNTLAFSCSSLSFLHIFFFTLPSFHGYFPVDSFLFCISKQPCIIKTSCSFTHQIVNWSIISMGYRHVEKVRMVYLQAARKKNVHTNKEGKKRKWTEGWHNVRERKANGR